MNNRSNAAECATRCGNNLDNCQASDEISAFTFDSNRLADEGKDRREDIEPLEATYEQLLARCALFKASDKDTIATY